MIFLVNPEYNCTWFNVSSPDSGRLLMHILYLIQSIIYIGSLFYLPDIIFSLSPSISLHVWAVGWLDCINIIICELTGSETWYLSDKIITLVIHSSWVGLHILALGCYASSFVVALHNESLFWKFQLQLNRCGTRKFSTLPFQINDIQITT